MVEPCDGLKVLLEATHISLAEASHMAKSDIRRCVPLLQGAFSNTVSQWNTVFKTPH